MEKLLTASAVAAICQIDLKTVHNWCERGFIAHFKTPGRHLRFRPTEVRDFLAKQGYPMPAELAALHATPANGTQPADPLQHLIAHVIDARAYLAKHNDVDGTLERLDAAIAAARGGS